MAEVSHSFNTAQGKYDVIKYSNGAEHMYSVTDSGNHEHLSHDNVIERHHNPELEAQWNEEREEQARQAGEVALDAVNDSNSSTEEIRPSLEARAGDAVWTNAKDEKNRRKVVVIGPSPKFPNGIDPRNNVLYVELTTEEGTHYDKVRADRLEYPDAALADGAASTRQAGRQMRKEADDIVDKLDEIIPPTKKEKRDIAEAEAYKNMSDLEKILHRFDKREEQRDKEYRKLLEAVELLVKGNKEGAEQILSEAKENLNKEEKPDKKDKAGEKKDVKPEDKHNGYPIRPETEEAIKNGDHINENGELNGKEDKEDTVDAEAMEASMARQRELLKQINETEDQEERLKLMQLLQEEQDKQKEIWDKGKEHTVGDDSVEAISSDEAEQNGWTRFRSKIRQAYDRLRGREPETAVAAAAVAEEGSGTKITVVDEKNVPIAEQKEKRRRRRLAGGVLGAAALVGAGVVGYYLHKAGQGPDTINHYTKIINDFCNGHGTGGYGPDHLPLAHHSHVDLSGINPNSINAQTPEQFQHGVLHLLEQQGIHAHGATPEKLNHMNHYMHAHGIASGMREGAHGLEQNTTNFPLSGQEFANAHASAEQGFRIGSDGTGREALDAWVREAERQGIVFTRS